MKCVFNKKMLNVNILKTKTEILSTYPKALEGMEKDNEDS